MEPLVPEFPARAAAGQHTGQVSAKAVEGRHGQLCLWRPSTREQRQHGPGSDQVFQAWTECAVTPTLSCWNHGAPHARPRHVRRNRGRIPETRGEGGKIVRAETEGASVGRRQDQSGAGRDRPNRSGRKRIRGLGTAAAGKVRVLVLCKPGRGIIFPSKGQNERPLCNHHIHHSRERQYIHNDHGIADR